MGFEIEFKYYERNDNGKGYNESEEHTMKKKIGESYEDVSYEKLAANIMKNMARRDILIFETSIFEFVKKSVSFREVKEGVIIGNKKYSYDDCESEIESKPALPPPAAPLVAITTGYSKPQQIDISEVKEGTNAGDLLYFRNKRPMREEVFAPKEAVLRNAAKKMPFTIGKSYPIYEEKFAPGNVQSGMIYTVRDDNNSRNLVSDKFFDMVPKLFAGELFNTGISLESNIVSSGDSMEGNYEEGPMPELRAR